MKKTIFRKGKEKAVPKTEKRTFFKSETIVFYLHFLKKERRTLWLARQDEQFISIFNLNRGERKP